MPHKPNRTKIPRNTASRKISLSRPNSVYLTDHDLSSRWTVSRDTVWRWTKLGKIPKPLKIGENTTRWLRSDIEAWEASREADNG